MNWYWLSRNDINAGAGLVIDYGEIGRISIGKFTKIQPSFKWVIYVELNIEGYKGVSRPFNHLKELFYEIREIHNSTILTRLAGVD